VSIPVALSPVRLATFGLKREAPIPKSEVTAEFEARFDSDTLFYDVFLDVDARCVMAIAPPPMNCAAAFDAARFRLGTDGPTLTAHVYHRMKYSVVRLPVPIGALPDVLQIEMNGRAETVPVRPSLCHALANRRIAYLLSKDSPLPWIEDWVRYNVTIHRADAVLFYDNGSTIYDTAALESTLASIEGLATFAVVPWRYPYGPEQDKGAGWEYCFCQLGALQHARWRFCRLGRGFLQSDIDELVVTEDGASIFDHLDRSGLPCLTYGGAGSQASIEARPRDAQPADVPAIAPSATPIASFSRTSRPISTNGSRTLGPGITTSNGRFIRSRACRVPPHRQPNSATPWSRT
jgi:hypothetical protein